MDKFFVNVIVGEPDHHGNMNEYGTVCYKFDNWQEASNFIKLSLDNGLIIEVRIPDNARDEQVI